MSMIKSLAHKWDKRRAKGKCKSAVEAAEKLVRRRIPVSEARLAELESMQQTVAVLPDSVVVPDHVQLLGMNLRPELADALLRLDLSMGHVAITTCEVHDRLSLLSVLARASAKRKGEEEHDSSTRRADRGPRPSYSSDDVTAAADEARGASLRSPLLQRGAPLIASGSDGKGTPVTDPPRHSSSSGVSENGPRPYYAFVLQTYGEELSDLEAEIIALVFMTAHPILVMATSGSEAAEEAKAITGGTWPVLGSMHAITGYVRDVLPRVLRLKHEILADVHMRTDKYKKVSKVMHGMKRGAVALVPFGVHAVNFLGMARLMRRMMTDAGMVTDAHTASALTKMGASSGLKVTAIDSLGDVYQFVVATNILSTATAAATAEGLSAALSTLDALDAAMLGSVSVVTGAVSAVGAYLTRPKLVESVAKLLANLSLVALLNHSMRRGDGGGDGGDCVVAEGGQGASETKNADKGRVWEQARGGVGDVEMMRKGGRVSGRWVGQVEEDTALRAEVEAEAAAVQATLMCSKAVGRREGCGAAVPWGISGWDGGVEGGVGGEGGVDDFSDLDLPSSGTSSWAHFPDASEAPARPLVPPPANR